MPESQESDLSLVPRKTRSEGRETPGWYWVETEANSSHADDGVQERLEVHSGISGSIRLGY